MPTYLSTAACNKGLNTAIWPTPKTATTMRTILIFSTLFLSTPSLLSAQSMASLWDANQVEHEVSAAVHLVEENILLALIAGVVFLVILFVCYVLKENAQSNRGQQAKHHPFLSLLVLILGMGMFCSSCGVSQTMQSSSSGMTSAHILSVCPHHQAYQEPFAIQSMYRLKGYPRQRISSCRFCGQKLMKGQE
jgi:NADH:ubiquinone oxidoreductase subunit 6 (subunit J)